MKIKKNIEIQMRLSVIQKSIVDTKVYQPSKEG